MTRLSEFFQSNNGGMSMSRLLMFGSFVITSLIVIWLTYKGSMNEGYFSMYIGAYAGTYIGGKYLDKKGE